MSNLHALSPAQSQQLFRVYLRALAEPGLLGELPTSSIPPLATAPLVLVDLIAPIAALDDASRELVSDIAATTGARVVEPGQARVAVASTPTTPQQLGLLHTASNFDPQTACLLIQQVETLGSGARGDAQGISLGLSGPGIKTTATLNISGVGRDFVEKRNELCAAFPRGVDIFFISRTGQVAGLPRSTAVTITGGRS